MGSQKSIDFDSILFHKDHKKSFIIVIFLLIIIFILVIYQTYYYKTEPIVKNTSLQNQESSPLCAEFNAEQDEITCEEALGIALAKYPGDAYKIDRTSIKLESEIQSVWDIKINLKAPLKTPPNETKYAGNKLEVLVDRNNGQIEYFGYI